MNEEISTNASPSLERAPIYKNRKITVILSVLLAVLILLNAAIALLFALGDKDGTAEAPAAFSYADADIKDYISNFSSALFTGKIFAGKEYAIDDVDDD